MIKSYECFLAVCETMHFTRAANILHISQQALSEQIKKLEDDMDVQLFVRKPKLALSPAGLILEESLKKMAVIERAMTAQISELLNIETGTVNIGIHSARALVVFSPILAEFHRRYPQVCINMVSDQTINYIKLLERGSIDFFFGINAPVEGRSNLIVDNIVDEPMYLIISSSALKLSFGDQYNKIIDTYRDGFDLSLLSDVPFIFSRPISHGQNAINKYLARKGITVRQAIIFEDYAISYKFISSIEGACFEYKTMLPFVESYNASLPENEKLYWFPLVDFHENLSLSLTRYSGAYLPPYSVHLYNLIKKTYQELVSR